jgi:hypothetical protein
MQADGVGEIVLLRPLFLPVIMRVKMLFPRMVMQLQPSSLGAMALVIIEPVYFPMVRPLLENTWMRMRMMMRIQSGVGI